MRVAQQIMFIEDAGIDSAAESITDYIYFCVDSIIPQKTVKRYSNNKPYITEGIGNVSAEVSSNEVQILRYLT